MTPALLLLNRELKDKLPARPRFPLDDCEIRDRDRVVKEIGKKRADDNRRAKTSEICVGDTVLVQRSVKRSKFDSNFNTAPCTVISSKGPEAIIKTPLGKTYRRVKCQLKKIKPSETESNVGRTEETDEVLDSSGEENDSSSKEEHHDEIPDDELNLSIDAEPLFLGFDDQKTDKSNFNPPCVSTPMGRPERATKVPVKFRDYAMNSDFEKN